MGVNQSSEDAVADVGNGKKKQKKKQPKVRISRRHRKEEEGRVADPGGSIGSSVAEEGSRSGDDGGGGDGGSGGNSSGGSDGLSSFSSLSSALIDAFMDEINEGDEGLKMHPSSLEEEFYSCIPELHLARAEGNILTVLEWLAAMQECSMEADESAVVPSSAADQGELHRAAVLRHEILRASEAQVETAARAELSRLSKERKGPDSKVVRHRMKQIQRRCEKLGLDTARSDGRNKGEDGSSTGGGEGESAAAKRRESALLALIETCMTASEAILQPGGKPALSRPPPLGESCATSVFASYMSLCVRFILPSSLFRSDECRCVSTATGALQSLPHSRGKCRCCCCLQDPPAPKPHQGVGVRNIAIGKAQGNQEGPQQNGESSASKDNIRVLSQKCRPPPRVRDLCHFSHGAPPLAHQTFF